MGDLLHICINTKFNNQVLTDAIIATVITDLVTKDSNRNEST